jgi:two-component system response regulator NreC
MRNPFQISLTNRQKQVIKLIAEGWTVNAMAGLFNLAPQTIQYHRHTAMVAIGVKDTASITKFAIAAGLTPVGGW